MVSKLLKVVSSEPVANCLFVAGIPIESLKRSRTAVFSASMTDDYSRMVSKDPETAPRMAITGTFSSIIPNRVSWFFDLAGPSVHVDTACSGSLVALDLACQSLASGDAAMVSSGLSFKCQMDGLVNVELFWPGIGDRIKRHLGTRRVPVTVESQFSFS